MNKSKKLVMVGNHIGGKTIIESLINKGYTFEYFVCLSSDQGKKYKVSGYYDYTLMAKKYNIPIYYVQSFALKSQADIGFFKKHQFDLLIQGGWQRLFPGEVLSSLGIGALGFHGSADFLPKGMGRLSL